MSDDPAAGPSVAASSRRTVVLLAAWIAAALIAGLPAGRGSSANASTRAGHTLKFTHSGPECLAGHAPAPKSSGKQ